MPPISKHKDPPSREAPPTDDRRHACVLIAVIAFVGTLMVLTFLAGRF